MSKLTEQFHSAVSWISQKTGLTPAELKQVVIFPLIGLAIIIMGDNVWRALGLPDAAATIAFIKRMFVEHGYPLVFISAFIEALLLIGLYLPGSLAMILAATIAGQGLMDIRAVISLITLGMFLAVTTNYVLGRYGWYKVLVEVGLEKQMEAMKARAQKKGSMLIHLTYFNPNVASLSATSLGILHSDFKKFLLHSVIALAYWNTAWGLSFYFLGNWIEERVNYTSVIVVILSIIAIRAGYLMYKKRKAPAETPAS